MSMYTFVLIILWFFVACFIIALLTLVFFYGRSTVKDNPKRALIYVKHGNHVSKPIKGKMIGMPTAKGYRYNYGKNTVLVPSDYKELYLAGKRLVFVNYIGQLIASPFIDDKQLSANERDELIYEICESHIGADGMRALKGNGLPNTMTIIVIAIVICALVVFGYNYMQKSMTPTSQNTQTIDSNNTGKGIENGIEVVPIDKFEQEDK